MQDDRVDLVAVVDHLPSPVAVVRGGSHEVMLLNAAYRRLCGMPLDGAPYTALAGAHGPEFFEVLDAVCESGRTLTLPGVAVVGSHGASVVLDVTFVPLPDGAGRPTVLVHGLDVSRNLDSAAEHRAQDRELVHSRAERVRQNETVILLQDTVLPKALPVVTGHQLAARYLAPSEDLGIGGDWFDVFVLPDGRIGLCVGDVAGHGVEAVHVMGQLRSAGRVAAFLNPDPAAVLAAKNSLMINADLGPFATALFGAYEPGTGILTFACAGHLPPVRVAGGVADVVETPDGLPLGVQETTYETASLTLAPGDSLVLYTDGLVERRDESLETGLARLLDGLPTDATTASGACDRILAHQSVVDDRTDDVCVLVLARDA